MFVDAFIKGLRANPFSESLIQNRVDFMAERTDRVLGHLSDSWCKFHQAHRHDIERCYALKAQLAKLAKEGHLRDYEEPF